MQGFVALTQAKTSYPGVHRVSTTGGWQEVAAGSGAVSSLVSVLPDCKQTAAGQKPSTA